MTKQMSAEFIRHFGRANLPVSPIFFRVPFPLPLVPLIWLGRSLALPFSVSLAPRPMSRLQLHLPNFDGFVFTG